MPKTLTSKPRSRRVKDGRCTGCGQPVRWGKEKGRWRLLDSVPVGDLEVERRAHDRPVYVATLEPLPNGAQRGQLYNPDTLLNSPGVREVIADDVYIYRLHHCPAWDGGKERS